MEKKRVIPVNSTCSESKQDRLATTLYGLQEAEQRLLEARDNVDTQRRELVERVLSCGMLDCITVNRAKLYRRLKR